MIMMIYLSSELICTWLYIYTIIIIVTCMCVWMYCMYVGPMYVLCMCACVYVGAYACRYVISSPSLLSSFIIIRRRHHHHHYRRHHHHKTCSAFRTCRPKLSIVLWDTLWKSQHATDVGQIIEHSPCSVHGTVGRLHVVHSSVQVRTGNHRPLDQVIHRNHPAI